MRSFDNLAGAAALALASCAASPDSSGPPVPASTIAAPSRASASAAVQAPPPSDVSGAPLSGAPRLVIENHSTADIRLYTGSIVDEEGKLGTMALWPHPSDCPKYEPKERLLPLRGTYDLAPPAHEYDDERCALGRPLPPGRYVVHIDSGYGSELYASAEITLPLAEPVRLKMMAHESPPACTPIRAQRAARLVLAAAKAAGTPEAALRDCDPKTAGCGTLPLPEAAPPGVCTMTLHENLLRIRRPPRGDAPKEITSWLDHDLVYAQRAAVSRSSSAELLLGRDRVVFEGMTGHHMHEHGGDAAPIGSMQVRVFNASRRTLKVRAVAVDWLADHSCGVPQQVSPQPSVAGVEPKELPPGTTDLSIGFTTRSAYQAHCDVFASRAHLEVEGHAVVVTSEHEVTRIEPLRR